MLFCGRMLREEQKHGHILLRDFYFRRAFRILPPALLYLLTLAVLSPILKVTKHELVSALFFFRNYALTGGVQALWFTVHFWSLAVEEHFYLLLPAIMVLFPKRRVWVLGALTICVVAWRWWAHQVQFDEGYRTDTIIDALLIAALLAIAANSDHYAGYLRRLLSPLASLLLLTMYAALIYIKIPFHLVVQSVIVPLVLLGTSQNSHNLLGRFLEWAPLCWVGRLPYILYLWQQLFFCDKELLGPLPLGVLENWPLKLVGLVGCSAISYYTLERPMMRLGHRIASSGIPGRGSISPNIRPKVSCEAMPWTRGR